MFDLKIGYLQDENFNLRRQLNSLRQLITVESNPNERSLAYQLHSLNDKLSQELQSCKDELLLEKQARQIQNVQHQQIIQQLNRCIFQLKKQISVLQNIVREQKDVKGQGSENKSKYGSIGQLFRYRQQKRQQYLHDKIDPVMMFEVIQELLQGRQQQPSEIEQQEQLNNTQQNLIQRPQSTKHILQRLTTKFSQTPKEKTKINQTLSLNLPDIEQNSEVQLHPKQKWREERSSIYFLKQGQNKQLRLNLEKAKEMQKVIQEIKATKNRQEFKVCTDVELLRKSYFQLIGEYQVMKKRVRALASYIEELQNRNSLLLKSRLCIRIE